MPNLAAPDPTPPQATAANQLQHKAQQRSEPGTCPEPRPAPVHNPAPAAPSSTNLLFISIRICLTISSPVVLLQLIHCAPAKQFFRRHFTFLLPCCSSTAYQLFFRCLSNALVPVQPALMLPGLMLLFCSCAVLLPVCLTSLLFSRTAYLQLLTSAAKPQNRLLQPMTALLPLCRKRQDVCSRCTGCCTLCKICLFASKIRMPCT